MLAAVTVLLLVMALLPWSSLRAFANTGGDKLVGGFEIDGNFPVDGGGTDWNAVLNAATATDEVNTGSAHDTTNFTSGSKECTPQGDCSSDNWVGATNTAPGKDDIHQVFVSSTVRNDSQGNPNLWGFFGITREANSGTTFYDIELNQAANHANNGISVPTRTDGDVLIIATQSGNGAFTVNASVQRWIDKTQNPADNAPCESGLTAPCWGVPAALSSLGTEDFYGLSNDAQIPGFQGVGTLDAREFAEMSVNLTAAGAALGCPSTGFTTANIRSKSSTSGDTGDVTGTAALKDYVNAPINIPSSCGELKIYKKKNSADGSPLAGATFKVSPNPIPGGSGDLTVTDGGANDHDGTANGVVDIDPAKPGTYTVTEIAAPSPWIIDPNSHPVTVDPFGSGANAATLTIVDHTGSITWQKNDATTGAKIAYSGAVFEVYGPEATQAAAVSSSTLLETVTDNGSNDANSTVGKVEVTGLGTGWYRIHEKTPPAGYTADATDQTAQITDASRDVDLTDTPFTDTRVTFKLIVKKLASDGTTVLDGAHFSLYQVGENGGADTLVGTCVTGQPANPYSGTGECEVAGLAWGHSYYWKETAPPPGYNLPSTTTSGAIAINRTDTQDALPVTTFQDPQTGLTTTATGATIGNAISDSATLSNLNGTIDGSVLFTAYGPFATDHEGSNVCTEGNVAYTSGQFPVTQNGTVGPASFTPKTAGYYYWVAAFTSNNGDNASKTGVCDTASEISHVAPVSPSITTSATSSVTVGGVISDTATLHDAFKPTGTVTFTLYSDSKCQTPVAGYSSTVDLAADGTATSDPYTTKAAGTYYWIASYSGDVNNAQVAGNCGDEGEQSTVNPATPRITTSATSSVTVGGAITDTATLHGAYKPTGTVTFTLYSDSKCQTAVAGYSSTVDLAADGTATSDPYTTKAAGTYYWIASYSGDNNNVAVAGDCGDEGEQSTVNPATPTITTSATSSVTVGGAITDTATLHGAFKPTGTVTFTLYSDSKCQTAVAGYSSTVDLAADGTATSDPYTTKAAGTYYWIASYSCDNNNVAVAGNCGDDNEQTVVNQKTPTITTRAQADATLVASELSQNPTVSIQDTAALQGATADAGGSVTFTLFGPTTTSAPDCAGTAIASSTKAVQNGQAVSDAIAVSAPGYYWWVASYSGDANNAATAGQCGDANEVTHVTQGSLALSKTADPAAGSIVQPGQTINYTVSVPNAGNADVTDATVTDTLPAYVVVDTSSISSGGTFTAGSDITKSAGTITWTGVNVPAGSSTNLTYTVTVSTTVPQGEVLTNLVQLGSLSASTTHQVAAGALSLSKSVVTLAGDNNGSYTSGDDHNTLVYTLTGSSSGSLVQTNVVVTDYIPGYDPGDKTSGKTTYVANSATCSIAGCAATYDSAKHLLTWQVGTVQPGATFTVGFKVTIDQPSFDSTVGLPAEQIDNVGFVQADRQGQTPSNQVKTPVTAVLGVKVVKKPVKKPQVLPFTGMPAQEAITIALLMIGAGIVLTAVRRREQ